MVYISGVIGATILEYVTGWGMERLFKMKYWDYSNQHFQYKGHICLSSSIAWGFLSIAMVYGIQPQVERFVGIWRGIFYHPQRSIRIGFVYSVVFV